MWLHAVLRIDEDGFFSGTEPGEYHHAEALTDDICISNSIQIHSDRVIITTFTLHDITYTQLKFMILVD